MEKWRNGETKRMNIEVTLSPEQVNDAVANAIIHSAIGEELKRIIAEKIKTMSRSYDNPIDRVVGDVMNRTIREVVERDYAAEIERMVSEKMTEKFTLELFNKMWDSFEAKH
jgi:hypothetical protein